MNRTDDLLWQQWDEVDSLLDGALDLPVDERPAHVAAAAAGDPALRDLVLRLLDQLQANGDRVTCPSDSVVLEAFARGGEPLPVDDLGTGTEVGRYQIIRRLGRGGMATVYQAERSDGTYEQRVALKVLRRGLDTEDLIRRFMTERQILSSLTHPNIARLLDGGSLPDGRPYLVMELVDGKPITTHCDQAALGLRARLDLFREVVGAVSAAHRQLVVHRDIKPSNILVDPQGRVKLLDFGIAKLLAGAEGHTAADARALTPDYASPEQVQGGVITTGTDVYQLGLLLRELLTGLRPQFGDTRPGEPPIRPSRGAALTLPNGPGPEERARVRGTTAARLARALRGDLDVIVSRALRPEPAERYSSADELAEDIRRYLRGLPIRAHPESWWYRTRKFAGRHPLVVPGGVAAVLALVVFITTLTVQNQRITVERDAAEMATRRALATQEFLVDFLRAPDPTGQAPSRDITVAEALQRGRTRLADELADQPEVRAALLGAIGRTYSGLGRFETADTVLQESLRLLRDHYGPDDVRLAGALRALGNNYRGERDFGQADSVLHRELQLRVGAGPVPDTVLAGQLSMLSGTRRDLGDQDSAVSLAARAADLHRRSGDTASTAFIDLLAGLAYVLRGADRLDSAETIYREVLRRQVGHPGVSPNALGLTHNNLGYLLRVRGDYLGAEQSYLEAVRLSSEALGDGHPTTMLFRSNLAGALNLAGKFEELEAVLREQIDAAERQWPDGHWRVGSAHAGLGRLLLQQKRARDAVTPYEVVVRSYAQTIGPGHTWTVVARLHLGAAQLLSGRGSQGAATLSQALGVLSGVSDFNQDSRAQLGQLATILDDQGEARWAARVRQVLPES